MSSRALRKAQREREEQERLRQLEEEERSSEGSDDEIAPARPQKSAFAMLDEAEEDDDEEQEEAQENPARSEDKEAEEESEEPVSVSRAVPKRKKKKKKAKGVTKLEAIPSGKDDSVDDIDLALKSLSTNNASSAAGTDTPSSDPKVAEVCKLLSVDAQHLHAQNEMRRLFGRAALESHDDDEDGGAGRRRGRGQQQGLAAAVGRRQGAQGGRGAGLGLLGLRRNIFIQGKEEWPVGTSGGLGMEIEEKRADGTVLYRFVHNKGYQDVQGQFDACVASMDPQRMVQLLQFNPYHVSTILQVSEIAKQERDHTTSGDLLERALFSFGRAVHSTFATNLSQGKARLDFRRPENREFWLAGNRYITNLSMRSTWRTVYEWSKLLLSLDPENDPYGMRLVIDQYALRAKQPQQFVDIAKSATFNTLWKPLPNIQLSLGLAQTQAGEAQKGKQTLYTALSRHSHVASRLFQQLNIDPPPAIWGKGPRTDYEKLHTELYAQRAKDIWASPEASNTLVEVASAIPSEMPDAPLLDYPISFSEGRHVLLTDKPELIALLPRSISGRIASASDPLPPDDHVPSYTPRAQQGRSDMPRRGPQLGTQAENLRELQTLYRFFSEMFPWFHPRDDGGPEGQRPPDMTEEEIERRIEESGVPEEVIVQRSQRMMELQQGLMAGVGHGEGAGQETGEVEEPREEAEE